MPRDFHIIDDTPNEPESSPDEDRLNRTRIRAIAHDRRAAHRRLMWARAIVLVFACLAVMAGVDAFRLEGPRRGWFLIGSACFVALAVRAALRLHRFDLRKPENPESPPTAQSFEALSDGRQFARGLDDLTRNRE